jgi:hypothetical protein
MKVIPLVLIVLAMPLIVGVVPRNWLYGFRTWYTLSSDAVWYRANRFVGVVVVVAGGVGVRLDFLLSVPWSDPARQAADALGWMSFGVAGHIALSLVRPQRCRGPVAPRGLRAADADRP